MYISLVTLWNHTKAGLLTDHALTDLIQTKKLSVRECMDRSRWDFQLFRSCIPPVFSLLFGLPCTTAKSVYSSRTVLRISAMHNSATLLVWDWKLTKIISKYRGPEPFIGNIDLTYCHSVRQSVGDGYCSASMEHITVRSLGGDLNQKEINHSSILISLSSQPHVALWYRAIVKYSSVIQLSSGKCILPHCSQWYLEISSSHFSGGLLVCLLHPRSHRAPAPPPPEIQTIVSFI